jgi:hypothetical protein
MIQNGWLLIILGAVFIGIGGIFGTLGWNKLSTLSQKKNILASVTRECESNKKMIDDAVEAISQYNGTGWNFSYRPYKSTQVDAFLTSGIFSFRGHEATSIREELEKYEEAIEEFNAGLRVVGRHNPGLFVKNELIHDQAKLKANLKQDGVECVLSEKFVRLKNTNEKVLGFLSQKRKLSKF